MRVLCNGTRVYEYRCAGWGEGGREGVDMVCLYVYVYVCTWSCQPSGKARGRVWKSSYRIIMCLGPGKKREGEGRRKREIEYKLKEE